jgi:diketogulonate reductase-like aldo/keto reductase
MSKPFDGRDETAGECAAACVAALDMGYRLIDTAQGYSNEDEVGAALAGRARSSFFVVTKLAGANHGRELTTTSLRGSLAKLGLAQVDCFLIHNPRGGKLIETWKAMLECKALGLARSVGVSNFGVEQLQGLAHAGLALPEVNQVELHVWLQQPALVQYCEANHIALMGYRPTANGFRFGMTETGDVSTKLRVLEKIAAAKQKTVAQIAIRWSVQRGFVTIPKTVRPERLAENAEVMIGGHVAALYHRLPTSYCLSTSYQMCFVLSYSVPLFSGTTWTEP